MSGGASGPDWYVPREDDEAGEDRSNRNDEGPDARALRGRLAFLEALEQLRPQSLTDLLDTVGPSADPLPDPLLFWLAPLESGSSNIARVREEFHELPDTVVEGWSTAAEQVAEGIRAWGKRWNLRDPWLHDAALGVLQADRRGDRGFELGVFSHALWPHPDLPTPPGAPWAPLQPIIQRIQEATRTWSGLPPGEALVILAQGEPPDSALGFQSWNPLSREARAEAKARIMGAVEAYVDDHLGEMESWARRNRAKPMPQRLKWKGRPAEEPYGWLVRWQVPPCETQKEIADGLEPPQGPKGIQVHIRKTAAEIGLTRRSRFTRRSEA